IGCSGPPAGARPSTVKISAPSACTAYSMHERTLTSSNSIVQAPHTPCSQPRCVPRRPRSSRRKSARVFRISTSRSYSVSLTVTWMVLLRSIAVPFRSPQGLLQRPTRQHANEVSPVFGRSVDVGTRFAQGSSSVGGGGERFLCWALPHQQ